MDYWDSTCDSSNWKARQCPRLEWKFLVLTNHAMDSCVAAAQTSKSQRVWPSCVLSECHSWDGWFYLRSLFFGAASALQSKRWRTPGDDLGAVVVYQEHLLAILHYCTRLMSHRASVLVSSWNCYCLPSDMTWVEVENDFRQLHAFGGKRGIGRTLHVSR